jgi:hypothetical protein
MVAVLMAVEEATSVVEVMAILELGGEEALDLVDLEMVVRRAVEAERS